MEATGIANLGKNIGKHLAHLLDFLADFGQINQFQRTGQKLAQSLILPSSDEELSQVKVLKIEPAITGVQEIVKDVVGDRRFPLPTDDGVCHKVSPMRLGVDVCNLCSWLQRETSPSTIPYRSFVLGGFAQIVHLDGAILNFEVALTGVPNQTVSLK